MEDNKNTQDIFIECCDDSDLLQDLESLNEDSSNKTVDKARMEQDISKVREKFEGLYKFFVKAIDEDIFAVKKESLPKTLKIHNSIIQAIKDFSKYEKDILSFINRMIDNIYEDDITGEEYLKFSDREFRDIRQKMEQDTDKLRDTQFNKGGYIEISGDKAFSLISELNTRYESIMRRLSREIEETVNRRFTITALATALSIPTFGLAMVVYLAFMRNYLFKAFRAIYQIMKFRRIYKERYTFIVSKMK